MIEDREELPQRVFGRDPNDERPRRNQPEARCESHRRGLCRCGDDGTGAPELHLEDELR